MVLRSENPVKEEKKKPILNKIGKNPHPLLDNRELHLGRLSPKLYFNRLSCSEAMLQTLDMDKVLPEPSNLSSLSFNAEGNLLISARADRNIVLWDWAQQRTKFSFPSTHLDSIVEAKFLPFSNNRTIISCSGSGQVISATMHGDGSVKSSVLGQHRGKAFKITMDPTSAFTFYTCGADGVVKQFDHRSSTNSIILHHRRSMRYGVHNFAAWGLYAMAIDPRNLKLFAVGGNEESVYLYDIRYTTQPVGYFGPPDIGYDGLVTALAFSKQSEVLVSYLNGANYMFTPRRDFTCSFSNNFIGNVVSPLYSGYRNWRTVNFLGANSEYVVSGSNCSRIFIWKKTTAEVIRLLGEQQENSLRAVVNVEPHPHEALFASSGLDPVITVWAPKPRIV